MLDAGSTGSRVHVYKFDFCVGGKPPNLLSEVFEHNSRGLSSFQDPRESAESIKPLLEIAVQSVPEHQRPCTPIALKATAGLRLLPGGAADKILDEVRILLRKYPFRIAGDDAVEIMDGSKEGVYAWVTVNFLLGRIGGSTPVDTVAIMDLGGASTQIVYEPKKEWSAYGNNDYSMDFAGRHFKLFQNSYLGYGLNEARKSALQVVVASSSPDSNGEFSHPCIPVGRNVTVNGKTLQGSSTGLDSCISSIRPILNKTAKCPASTCSFNGVPQPRLSDYFRGGELYAFSYFYDFSVKYGMPEQFKVKDLKVLADTVCNTAAGKTSKTSIKLSNPSVSVGKIVDAIYKDSGKPEEVCVNVAYMYILLSEGYEIGDEEDLFLSKKIKGYETGWCLGATIALLMDGTQGTC